MENEKRVTDIIAEVQESICSNYCKFPEKYTSEEWEEHSEEICKNCPLDRL